ncbi:MAG: hemolysin family protein [Myxococcota bacterium]
MLNELLIIVALILANGVFSGAEIAIISLRKSRMAALLEEGRRGARAVERLRTQPESFLATVQVGITVVGATAAAFGGATLAARLTPLLTPVLGKNAEEVSFAIVVALVSYLSLILGELVPKSLALRSGEAYALLIGQPLLWLSTLARPVVWLLTGSSNLVLRLFGDRTSFTEALMSREEVQHVVEEAGESGSIDVKSSEMASRALELVTLTAADVMVPRPEVVSLARTASLAEVRHALVERGHSRVPVHSGNPDDVVGYLSSKDVLKLLSDGQPVVVANLVRPAYFVPLTMSASNLLKEMQQRKVQIAIVVDELGSMSGLVTMEDLVEEVVGDIFNEHDVPDAEGCRAMPDGSFLVRGSALIRDVNRRLGIELPEGETWSTVAGLCLARVGAIPAAGTTVTEGDVKLTVEEATAHRVRTVRITLPNGPRPRDDANLAGERR